MTLADRYARLRREKGTGEDASIDGTSGGRALWERSRARKRLQIWTVRFVAGSEELPHPRPPAPLIVVEPGTRGPSSGGTTTGSTIQPSRTEREAVLS
jgi:hypothetical protein